MQTNQAIICCHIILIAFRNLWKSTMGAWNSCYNTSKKREECIWKWSPKCKVHLIFSQSSNLQTHLPGSLIFDIEKAQLTASCERAAPASGQLLIPVRDKRRWWRLLGIDPTVSSLIRQKNWSQPLNAVWFYSQQCVFIHYCQIISGVNKLFPFLEGGL